MPENITYPVYKCEVSHWLRIWKRQNCTIIQEWHGKVFSFFSSLPNPNFWWATFKCFLSSNSPSPWKLQSSQLNSVSVVCSLFMWISSWLLMANLSSHWSHVKLEIGWWTPSLLKCSSFLWWIKFHLEENVFPQEWHGKAFSFFSSLPNPEFLWATFICFLSSNSPSPWKLQSSQLNSISVACSLFMWISSWPFVANL